MASLFPAPQQYFDNNGDPLAGGKVYFYEAGTTTPKDTFTDEGGATPNANPVILDASGRASIWGTGSYKEVVRTSADVLVQTTDDVSLGGASIGAGTVTNTMLADMAANTVKVRAASTTGVPSDIAVPANGWVGRGATGNLEGRSGQSATTYDAGTISSGTFTPDADNGNIQMAVNGGAHTLAPPATVTVITVQYTNNASAGVIDTSGFTRVSGDPLTTTDGDDFFLDIRIINGKSQLIVHALQ